MDGGRKKVIGAAAAAVVAAAVIGVVAVSYMPMQGGTPIDGSTVTTSTSPGGTATMGKEVVTVGVMLPATGDLASHGQDNRIATELALVDFNAYLDEKGADWEMDLVVEDTQTDPVVALEKIQSLNSKGVSLILGTETSAELRNIKSYADTNNMMLISPSSTSPKLAMADNIFRLVPDDTKQSRALAALMSDMGIRVAVPVYRADVWGDGLFEATKASFEEAGGVVDDGIRYSPEITVFSTEADLLDNAVRGYTEGGEYSVEEVAVLMIGFSEVVHFMNSASSYDSLKGVRWLGSDASANDDAITDDPISSQFARETGFLTTQFSASDNPTYDRVADHLVETIGSLPSNYAYSSYDSLWVLGLTIEEVGSADVDSVKGMLAEVASGYEGAIGRVVLNEAGDLSISDYELWHVDDTGTWEQYGRYLSSTGEIIAY